MTFLSVIAIAIALAMDAFAVAIATGIQLGRIERRQVFRLSWHFGLFQAMMPIIGWYVGLSVHSCIERYDHWVAFVLLGIVGSKMIKEAFAPHEQKESKVDPTTGFNLIFLSVATSIDALAVGLSLYAINVEVWIPACVIGVVAAAFTTLGLYLGSKASNAAKFGSYAEIIGGIVLLAIATNILYSHNVFT